MSSILFFSEIRESDLPCVGAKTMSLARMKGMELPVPDGFCLTTDLYTQFISQGTISELIKKAVGSPNAENLSELLENLRKEFIATEIDEEVSASLTESYKKLIKEDGVTAVRSSSTAEDLEGLSFAGQYDTYTGISSAEECIQAVKKCWASLWTERVFRYREKNGVPHIDAAMAVIVQQLIRSDAAGVLFTVDPVTGDDWIVMEGCFGLGEGLVSGKITPDRFIISKDPVEISKRDIARKTIAVSINGEESSIDEEKGKKQCIDDFNILDIAVNALKAELEYGIPLDIEWAVEDKTVYLLQARPVTTVPLKKDIPLEDRLIWTNANTGEVLPDVVTPFTWSFVNPVAIRLIGSFLRQTGIDIEKMPILGVFGGRAYFCLSALAGILRHIPGMKKKSVTELFGGQNEELSGIEIKEEDMPDLHFSIFRFVLNLPIGIFRILSFTPGRANKLIDRARNDTARFVEDYKSGLNPEECVKRIRLLLDEIMDAEPLFRVIGLGVLYTQLFYDKCVDWLGKEQGGSIASRMLAGIGANDNAASGIALWRLAQEAKGHDKLKDSVLSAETYEDLRETLEGSGKGEDFLTAWDYFMDDHGHHCRGELEFHNMRWRETPDYILNMVKSYINAPEGEGFFERYEKLSHGCLEAEQEGRAAIKNPVKRYLFSFLGRRARKSVVLRENLKNQIVTRMAVVRNMLLDIDADLISSGRLKNKDDIFFLNLDELQQMMSDAELDIQETVDERRTDYDKYLEIIPPPVIIGSFDPSSHVPMESYESKEVLNGIAVNPGKVTGKAKVILREGEGSVEPGEILVAPFTDPGWTPYFLNAAAIVMDQGGLLSHGSIVAREYGIPAVVNVGPGTKIIKTGQMIEVDGTKGIVKILKNL